MFVPCDNGLHELGETAGRAKLQCHITTQLTGQNVTSGGLSGPRWRGDALKSGGNSSANHGDFFMEKKTMGLSWVIPIKKFLSFTAKSFHGISPNSGIQSNHENMGGNQLSEEKTQLVPAAFQPQQSFFGGFLTGDLQNGWFINGQSYILKWMIWGTIHFKNPP